VADVAGQPKFRRYVVFEKVGAGSFAEIIRTADRLVKRIVSHGTAYQYKAHAEDVNGNETGDSNTVSITPAKIVDGTYIVDSSINQGRSYTGTGSTSASSATRRRTAPISHITTYVHILSFIRQRQQRRRARYRLCGAGIEIGTPVMRAPCRHQE
jgi:hypothetical protein